MWINKYITRMLRLFGRNNTEVDNEDEIMENSHETSNSEDEVRSALTYIRSIGLEGTSSNPGMLHVWRPENPTRVYRYAVNTGRWACGTVKWYRSRNIREFCAKFVN